MIKTEKELLRLIWKEMGLGGHNSDMKKRIVIAKEVHKAVEFGLKDCPPGTHEEMLDAIAELFSITYCWHEGRNVHQGTLHEFVVKLTSEQIT